MKNHKQQLLNLKSELRKYGIITKYGNCISQGNPSPFLTNPKFQICYEEVGEYNDVETKDGFRISFGNGEVSPIWSLNTIVSFVKS